MKKNKFIGTFIVGKTHLSLIVDLTPEGIVIKNSWSDNLMTLNLEAFRNFVFNQ